MRNKQRIEFLADIRLSDKLRKKTLVTGVVLGASIVATFVAGTAYLTRQQSINEYKALARVVAANAVERTDRIRVHTFGAFEALERRASAQPCSAENLALMKRLSYGTDLVVDVGYIHNNRLMCSAYGSYGDGIALPAPDYISPSGAEIRQNIKLPFTEGDAYFTTTRQSSGYTAILLKDWSSENFADLPVKDIALGTFNAETQKILFARGTLDPKWIGQLQTQEETTVYDGEHIVAFKRSPFNYVGFAVIPAQGLAQLWRAKAMTTVPIGLAMGLALSYLLYWLNKRQHSIHAMLKVALKNNEFFMVYQPVVELRTGRWVGVEALIRWKRNNGEFVPPDVFIPVAEQCGLITEVTEKVITMVMRDTRELLVQQPGWHVAVNFSGEDLKNAASQHRIAEQMRAHGFNATHLIAEITERVFVDAEEARARLQALRSMGVAIAIDDFGTGYSSLAYLTQLELDYLKIDKTFVDTIGTEAVTSEVVGHIIALAKSLNLQMIAEGVETQQQADFLRERDVQFAQGWLFAKPMPIAELLTRLAAPRVPG